MSNKTARCDVSQSSLQNPEDRKVTLLFIGIDALLIMLILLLNLFVVISIMLSKRLHCPFHLYILSLCLSDLLVGTLALPMHMYINYFCPSDMLIHCVAHDVMFFVVDVGFVMTSYIMVAIAVDRFRAVVTPLRQTRKKRSVFLRIGGIVACGVTYATVMLFTNMEWSKHPEYHDLIEVCNISVPDDNNSPLEVLRSLMDFCLFYSLPLLVSACLYSRVIVQLWKETRQLTDLDSQVIGSLQSKKRAIKISISIVFVFSVMWLPYHSAHIYFNLRPDELDDDIWWLLPACNIFYYSYSWINSVVYVYFSETFRTAMLARWKTCEIFKRAGIYCRKTIGMADSARTADTRVFSVRSQTWTPEMVSHASSPFPSPHLNFAPGADVESVETHM